MSQRAQPPQPAPTGPGRQEPLRRPSSNSADTVRLDVEVLSDSSEIVVRNQQGEIELGDPPTPILETDEPEDRDESEKERQRLAEAVKHHSINHSTVPDQPEELLEAVRASLRAKVAALADDNWMFEAEDQIR
ncbi:Vacuolar protein sorting-associated protein 68 [Metarhizium acridum]|nr:Vacuolar protein sorting-associated protein 68 [Metarhizium acridum]